MTNFSSLVIPLARAEVPATVLIMSPPLVLFPTVPPVEENTQFDQADRSCAPAGGGYENCSLTAPAALFDFRQSGPSKVWMYQRIFAMHAGTAKALLVGGCDTYL